MTAEQGAQGGGLDRLGQVVEARSMHGGDQLGAAVGTDHHAGTGSPRRVRSQAISSVPVSPSSRW